MFQFRFWIILTLAAPSIFGQEIVRGGVSNMITFTASDYNLFVDPTGNDSNSCTASGSSACLTFTGALAKVPKVSRFRTTITAACGNYPGFYVSGFTQDNSAQQTTGGMLITGTLSNSPLATGTATGTATGGTAGSGATFGTLVDSGQTWTVNDLRGRFVARTGGTGVSTTTFLPISSNTATTITITGLWTAPVNGSSTYAIQDACTLITTSVKQPPTALATAGSTSAIVIQNNDFGTAASNGLVLQRMGLTASLASTGNGITISGPSNNVGLVNVQTGGLSGATVRSIFYSGAATTLTVQSSVLAKGSNVCVSTSGAAAINFTNTQFNCPLVGGAINIGSGSLGLTSCEVLPVFRGITVVGSAAALFQGTRINCDGSSGGFGLEVGDHHPCSTGSGFAQFLLTNDFEGCETSIVVAGGSLDATQGLITGTATQRGLNVQGGGKAAINSSWTMTSSGSGGEVGVDGTLGLGGAQSSVSTINSSGCLAGIGSGSSICKL